MARILVTGGAGFIGSNLVDSLVDRNHEVTIIDNLMSGRKENVNPKAKLIVKDIRENISDLFKNGKFDYVFHLAAQMNVRKSLENPMEDAEINILGGLNIIDNCVKHGVKKIIFSSTGGAIYSKNAKVPCTEKSEIMPESPYGLAKLTTESYLRIMKEKHGLKSVSLRYANVYGPRQNAKGEAGVISIFINNLIEGKSLRIFGSGKQTRDFVYVSDVVNANLIALEENLEGSYNVGTGEETSINELADQIKKIMKKNMEVVHEDAVKGELMRNALDSSKISLNGWKSTYSLDKGLRETVDWFTDNQ